ncbi:AT-rich interactive domain-containing protein 3A [Melanotaenia boesemani]|uniref:AT-rich interactive domain-containing protein 3A n=1 Tax=Melanotaenia boesemani TaxID=1250792 RepID=UPI001C03B2F5|nr:AT-rich interactive domain-containing protein 3A [Melanotaenia boesemani]
MVDDGRMASSLYQSLSGSIKADPPICPQQDSTARSLPVPAPSASCPSPARGAQRQQAAGGMKLEAVMENLQRQQAARLALEDKLRKAEKEKDLRSMESQIQQQALAFRHYQAAMRSSLAAGVGCSSVGMMIPYPEDGTCEPGSDGKERGEEEEGEEELHGMELMREEESDDIGPNRHQHRPSALQGACPSPRSGSLQSPQNQNHHEWTYEEQFKQLYELDDDEKRKEFLDDLFSFMQRRGTPVNRIPIMAKQVLDLYMLYKLVTEKGGLVEVINKKIWREITKGLNLPTSITSAAFTLRTQYMKYLYPYECEKQGLSSPGELQAAIDSNRREGRRQSYSSVIFNYSPVGTPNLQTQLPMIPHSSSLVSQTTEVKTEEPMMASFLPSRVVLPMVPSSHHAAAMTTQVAAAQTAALEELREKLERGEPPHKKMIMVTEEQQKIMEHALQQKLLAMATQLPLNIKLNNRDDRQETALNLSTSGISSINMSIEINGVVYTGILFARQMAITGMTGHHGKHNRCTTQAKSSPPYFQPACSSSSVPGHRNSSP